MEESENPQQESELKVTSEPSPQEARREAAHRFRQYPTLRKAKGGLGGWRRESHRLLRIFFTRWAWFSFVPWALDMLGIVWEPLLILIVASFPLGLWYMANKKGWLEWTGGLENWFGTHWFFEVTLAFVVFYTLTALICAIVGLKNMINPKKNPVEQQQDSSGLR